VRADNVKGTLAPDNTQYGGEFHGMAPARSFSGNEKDYFVIEMSFFILNERISPKNGIFRQRGTPGIARPEIYKLLSDPGDF
jgi:hypothetical protein